MVQAPLPTPNPRRISYVLPLPSTAPPLLSLPPIGLSKKGQIGPLYTSRPAPASTSTSGQYSKDKATHPRHRLAVQALAIDLSTSLHGETKPGGLLYTGGRDGLVCSWELGLPTKRRRHRYGKSNLREEEESGSDDDTSDSEVEGKGDRWRSDAVDSSYLNELDPELVGSIGRKSRGFKGRRNSSSHTTRGLEKEEPFSDSIPLEERYEVDDTRTKNAPLPTTRFRQCVQSHTDWVNDIILCDYNRTLVSASSDSLLLAWNPHSTNQEDQVCPKKIGTHGDYIRCLTGARDAGWVASGGFDRKIKIWDLAEGRSSAVVELPSPPASIYSIAATPSGSLLAAGTPERVIRVWDPRSRRQVARLGGHTDNVRGVLLGEDGKWLLSASSDTTVKLWSLAAQKCLHTFSHHSTSVWSLFSQHPNLEIFYSGDRSGNVCKIDIEGAGDPGDGECIVLARDAEEAGEPRSGGEGITQLVAQDDSWVWTAGGSSSVKRWRDVAPRRCRAGAVMMREQIEIESETPTSIQQSPVVIESPSTDSPWNDRDRSGLPSVSFIEGLTTTLSRTSSTPTPRAVSIYSAAQFVAPRPTSLRARPSYPLSQTQRPIRFIHDSGTSTPGFSGTLHEIPYDSLVPLTSLDDPYFSHALSSRTRDPETATIYSTVSVTSASLPRPSLSNSPPSQIRPHSLAETIIEGEHQAANLARREYTEREAASEATPLRSGPDEIIEGGHGLTRCELLNDRRHAISLNTEGEVALWDVVECTCIGIFSNDDLVALGEQSSSEGGSSTSGGSSSKDLIEMIKERIEGEVSVPTWCKCDTRVGALTVHLEEARAFDAEVYSDESHLGPNLSTPPDHRIILGKWVLRNLFSSFVAAEVELRTPNLPRTPAAEYHGAPTFISLSDLPPSTSLSRQPKTPGMTIALATPAVRPAVLQELPLSPPTSAHRPPLFDLPPPLFSSSLSISGAGTPRLGGIQGSGTPTGARTPTSFRTEGDYFSLLPAQESPTSSVVPLKTPEALIPPSPSPTPGLMNRFRFGKSSKRPNTGDASLAISTIVPVVSAADQRVFSSVEEEQQYRILESVLSRPLNPCSTLEAPYLPYDENMAVIISEETDDASAWAVTYRGLVGTGREDLPVLEQKAPFWLLDFLLGDRLPQKDAIKIPFVLQPWIDPIRAGLPSIPNAGNSRLTANRSLRISKVVGYIADKLDLRHPSTSRAPSISSFVGSNAPIAMTSSRGPVMDDFDPSKLEILCGDVVLPTRMSIATARAYYWKNGGDIILSYRLASINNI